MYIRGFFLRAVLKQSGVIPISTAHESVQTLKTAFSEISQALKDGYLVCIFPEGKITYDGKLGVFKSGVEKILAETPVQIIPMALGGLWGSFFSREGGSALKKLPKRFWSKVSLNIGKPISPEHVSADSLKVEVQKLLDQDLLA